MNDAMQSQLAAAATEAQGLLGDSAKLASKTILCVEDVSRRGEVLMIGGREVTLSLTVVATTDQAAFTKFSPAVGQLYVSSGKTYKVVTADVDELNWQLGVSQTTQ